MAALHNVSENAQLVDEEFMGKLKEQIPNLREVSRVEDCDFILNYCHNDTKAGLDPATVLQDQPNFPDTKPALVVKVHHTPDTGRTLEDNSYSEDRERYLSVNYPFYKNQGTLIRRKKNEDIHHVTDWILKVVNPMEPNVHPTNHSEHSVTDAQRGLTESRHTSAKIKHSKPSQTKKLKFLRGVSGHTLYSDKDFIKKLKQQVPNLKEVSTVEECDFILFFCPIVSRAGTDIEAALQKLQRLSDTKPAFVVVLHHTFDPDSVVPDSSRIVKRERTLSVDCLFHEDEGLLQCFRNDEALYNISEWINPQENISNPPHLFYGADPDTQEKTSTESADTKPPLVVKIHHTPDTTRTVVDNSYSDDGKKILTENDPIYKNQGTSIRHKKSEDVNRVVDLIQEEVVNPMEPNVWFTNHSEHSLTDAQRGLTESRHTSAKKRTAKHLKPSQRSTAKYPKPSEKQKLKFLRGVSGHTLYSDKDFIKKLKQQVPNLKEVSTVEECDFILFFCPIVSRAGTDIEAALQKLQRLSDTKPAFIVVLHHTFDPDSVVPDSSRIVKRERTLSVDCLFHEDEGLLQCFRNDEALYNISEWINPQENISNPPQLFKAVTL
ncbi:uncharacterized protein [Hoplias malabaricus]|uniref:uncharacterized protein n=1 Tax=Hoplias malabaricus TaxID=27720 RepID=UPI003461A925